MYNIKQHITIVKQTFGKEQAYKGLFGFLRVMDFLTTQIMGHQHSSILTSSLNI